MINSRKIFKGLLRAVVVLVLLTATSAVAQDDSTPQPAVPTGGGGGRGVQSATASEWGIKAESNAGASKWGIGHASTSSATAHLTGGMQAQQISKASSQGMPQKATRPASDGLKASAAGAAGAVAPVSTGPVFRGYAPVSHGNQRAQLTNSQKIAMEMKGHSTGHHSGGRGKPRGPSSAEPVSPKGEQDCDRASKLQLCTWL